MEHQLMEHGDELHGSAPDAGNGAAATARNGPPALAFAVLGAEPDATAATPAIALALEVTAPPGIPVCALALQVQARIDPRRRAYDEATRARLREVFGLPEQWSGALQSLLWTRTALNVGPFVGRTTVALALPCSYDLEVAASKVLFGLRDGVVPLELLFNGTVFHADADGRLRTALLPWDDGVRFDLPARCWHAALERFFPGTAWLRIERGLLERLQQHRIRAGHASWDALLAALLDRAEAPG
jgi:hypothetical protein